MQSRLAAERYRAPARVFQFRCSGGSSLVAADVARGARKARAVAPRLRRKIAVDRGVGINLLDLCAGRLRSEHAQGCQTHCDTVERASVARVPIFGLGNSPARPRVTLSGAHLAARHNEPAMSQDRIRVQAQITKAK